MPEEATPPAPPVLGPARVVVFVDFWNLQIGLHRCEQEAQRDDTARFMIDWNKLRVWLVQKAAETAGLDSVVYVGMRVYASYNPRSQSDTNLKNWLTKWLDRQAGIQVECYERRVKSSPKCPDCHTPIHNCPHCGERIRATEEKGVDTAIATDMIRLAWENAYDIAVLATSDSDLVPAVQYLDQKGKRVFQARTSDYGHELATSCWASFDVYDGCESFRQPPSA